MSQIKVNSIIHPTGTSNNITMDNAGNMTTSGTVAMATPFMFRNRIINGAMIVDQRNNGASVTGNDLVYGVDRFVLYASQSGKFTIQQNAGSVTPPAGFRNYLGFTSTSAYSSLSTDYFTLTHQVEGYNVADFMFGTSSAITFTLSFWVRSSLTGTFGGSFRNSAANRSFPFTYTISVANTWEKKVITLIADTAGTWLTTNGVGLTIMWDLGSGSTYRGSTGSWAASNFVGATGGGSIVGTNGATFYITGVQLEPGSVATPFEVVPYNVLLSLCQRYYYRLLAATAYANCGSGRAYSGTNGQAFLAMPVSMRIKPVLGYSALTDWNGAQTSGNITAMSVSEVSADFRQVTIDITATYTAGGTVALNANNKLGIAWMEFNSEL